MWNGAVREEDVDDAGCVVEGGFGKKRGVGREQGILALMGSGAGESREDVLTVGDEGRLKGRFWRMLVASPAARGKGEKIGKVEIEECHWCLV